MNGHELCPINGGNRLCRPIGAGTGTRWLTLPPVIRPETSISRRQRKSNVERERHEARRSNRSDWRHFRTIHWAIESVTFDGDATSSADQAFEFGARCEL